MVGNLSPESTGAPEQLANQASDGGGLSPDVVAQLVQTHNDYFALANPNIEPQSVPCGIYVRWMRPEVQQALKAFNQVPEDQKAAYWADLPEEDPLKSVVNYQSQQEALLQKETLSFNPEQTAYLESFLDIEQQTQLPGLMEDPEVPESEKRGFQDKIIKTYVYGDFNKIEEFAHDFLPENKVSQ